VKERAYLIDQAILSCMVGRKHVDTVVDAALAGGAPGANVSYAKIFDADSRATAKGIRFSRERAIVRIVLPAAQLTTVVLRVQAACGEHDIDEVCLYGQPVTRAVTYVAGFAHRRDVVAGGGPHRR
jgi:hypothetical protein